MQNVAKVELAADYSRLASGLRAAAGLVSSFAAGAAASMNKLALAPRNAKKGQGWVSHATGQVAGNVAMRGLDLVIEQGKKVFNFNEQLVRFGIAGRIPAETLAQIGAAARKTSTAIGTDAAAVLAGGRAYMDLAGAQSFSIKKMETLARVAQASGADTNDLAGMMWQLTNTMKVADDQIEETMGGLINQAKDGAIEAKQMAKEFASLLPLFARFKGAMGRDAANQVGAMFQVVRENFNSADEAGTGLVRVLAGIRTYASRFEKAGVRIWDVDEKGVKKARAFSEIFEDIAKSDLVKDPEKLKKAFGRTEGWRAMELLLENVPKLRMLEESGRRNGVIMQDLGTYTSSSAGRMAIAIEKMKNGFAEALTEERINQIVSGFERIADSIGPVMDALSSVFSTLESIADGIARLKNPFGDDYHEEPGVSHTASGKRALSPGLAAAGIASGASDDKRTAEEIVRRTKRNAMRDQLVEAENAFGPTDASIKMAIRMARADMSGGPDAIHSADELDRGRTGRWYLEQRAKGISADRFKRLQEQAAREDAAEAERTFNERRNAAIRRNPNGPSAPTPSDANPPWIGELAKRISEIVQGKPVQVNVDGNPVAKSAANASDQRRK